MKVMHQYCINKFAKECFTEHDLELQHTALGTLVLMYSSWWLVVRFGRR